jgi:hypothetical protein
MEQPETDGYSWVCPKCENKNALKLWTCGHCKSYKRPRPTSQRPMDGVDTDPRLCSYKSVAGKQCPLPGDASDVIGKDRPGWCGGHMKNKTGPEAEQVYRDNCENYEAIMAGIRGSFHNDPIGWVQRNRPELLAPSQKPDAPAPTAQEAEQRKRQAEELVASLQQAAPEGLQHVSEIVAEEYGEYIQQENPNG